jgi:hypothetical protein
MRFFCASPYAGVISLRFRGLSVMFQWCYSGVPVRFQTCYCGVTVVLQTFGAGASLPMGEGMGRRGSR